MLGRIVVGSVLLLGLSSNGLCQEGGSAPETKTNEQLTQDLETLKQSVAQLTELQSEMIGELKTLKTSNEELIDRIENGIEANRKRLDAIATTDAEGSQSIKPDALRLSANFDRDAAFRSEVADVVNRSIQTTGQLTIYNQMSTTQSVEINGMEWRIPAGENTGPVTVNVGTVSVQLPGQQLTNWTVGAPDYKEEIYIIPQKRQTALRPTHNTQPAVQEVLRPTQTIVEPIQTVYRPTQTIVEPVQTVYRPVQTIVQPVQQVFRPVQTTTVLMPPSQPIMTYPVVPAPVVVNRVWVRPTVVRRRPVFFPWW